MALFLFTKAILEGKPINVFNNGEMVRDFTYVDDIIESLMRLLEKPRQRIHLLTLNLPIPLPAGHHRVFNIGNSNPTPLMDYIYAVEDALGVTAEKHFFLCSPVMCRPQRRILLLSKHG